MLHVLFPQELTKKVCFAKTSLIKWSMWESNTVLMCRSDWQHHNGCFFSGIRWKEDSRGVHTPRLKKTSHCHQAGKWNSICSLNFTHNTLHCLNKSTAKSLSYKQVREMLCKNIQIEQKCNITWGPMLFTHTKKWMVHLRHVFPHYRDRGQCLSFQGRLVLPGSRDQMCLLQMNRDQGDEGWPVNIFSTSEK